MKKGGVQQGYERRRNRNCQPQDRAQADPLQCCEHSHDAHHGNAEAHAIENVDTEKRGILGLGEAEDPQLEPERRGKRGEIPRAAQRRPNPPQALNPWRSRLCIRNANVTPVRNRKIAGGIPPTN